MYFVSKVMTVDLKAHFCSVVSHACNFVANVISSYLIINGRFTCLTWITSILKELSKFPSKWSEKQGKAICHIKLDKAIFPYYWKQNCSEAFLPCLVLGIPAQYKWFLDYPDVVANTWHGYHGVMLLWHPCSHYFWNVQASSARRNQCLKDQQLHTCMW